MKKLKISKQHLLKPFIGCVFSLLSLSSLAQTKEVTQDLSKPARKGMLDETNIDKDGSLRITYKMKVDKKSDEVNFEDYVFDANLNFKSVEPYKVSKSTKATKPDLQVTTLAAFVGGTNSFSAISMTLKFEKEVWEKKWDVAIQKYKWGKRLSSEAIKMKDSDGKFRGFASYQNEIDGSQFVIASFDGKGDDDQFFGLYVTTDFKIKQTKFPVSGAYSLAFCGQLKNNNVFAILAPNKGNSNTKYVYIELTNTADVVTSFEFSTTSPNTAITAFGEEDGAIYLLGGSTKSNDAYNKVYTNYAPIDNPGAGDSKCIQMFRYEKAIRGNDFDNIHFIKIANNKVDFFSNIPVKSFKEKIKTPPSEKRGSAFDGNKFWFEEFKMTPSKEFLVTGQLYEAKANTASYSLENHYGEIVCLHLDSKGELKAQYAVNKTNDDKKSEVFANKQSFVLSADGKSITWEIMEVKGTKSYASWLDAYNGNATFRANFFPRIATINIADATVSNFTVLASEGKFLMYKYHTYLNSADGKTTYYIGHDEDYEKLWIGKYQMN